MISNQFIYNDINYQINPENKELEEKDNLNITNNNNSNQKTPLYNNNILSNDIDKKNLIINQKNKEVNLNNANHKLYEGKIELYDSSIQSDKNTDKKQEIFNSLEGDMIHIDISNENKMNVSNKNSINKNSCRFSENNNINNNNDIEKGESSYKEYKIKNILQKYIKIGNKMIEYNDSSELLRKEKIKVKNNKNSIENDVDGKENLEEDEDDDEEIQKLSESSNNFENKIKKYKEKNIKSNNIQNKDIQINKMSIKLLQEHIDNLNNEKNINESKIKNDINLKNKMKYDSENNSNCKNNNSSDKKITEKKEDLKRKEIKILSQSDRTYTKNYINKISNNKLKQNLYLLKYQKTPKNRDYSLTPEKYMNISRNNPQLLYSNSSLSNNQNQKYFNDSLYEYNNINGILMNLSDRNISKSYSNIIKNKKNCYNIFKEKTNKKISNIVNKYSFREKLSIVNIIQCLFDLNIINELIKKNHINNLDKEKIKYITQKIKENDIKKLEELEFLEQLWFRINPSGEDYIKSPLFLKLLKILFSFNNYSINDFKISNLSKNIENILIKNNINVNNNDNNIVFISPLRDIKYETNDIWSISRLIKKFFKLKNNVKFYNNIDSNYNRNKKYERKTKIKTEVKKNKEENQKSSKSPEIKYYTPKKIKKSSDDEIPSFRRKFKEIPVYERLYSKRKIYNGSKSTRNSKNEIYDFKPIFISNEKLMSKGFKNYSKEKKPKGYYDYILRNRILINQKENEKKIIDDKIYGKNYERIQKMKIEPFNITDLKEENINKRNNKIKEKYIYSKNIIDKIYITLDIKIPNGELKQLKIYKNDNNVIDLVDDFCEKYEMYEKDRDFLLSKVIQYKNECFEKIIIEDNNELNTN